MRHNKIGFQTTTGLLLSLPSSGGVSQCEFPVVRSETKIRHEGLGAPMFSTGLSGLSVQRVAFFFPSILIVS